MDKRRNGEILTKIGIWAFDKGHRFFLTKDVGVAERRGERLGVLYYRLDKKHRERTHSNLRMAFPEWSDARVAEVSLGVYKHYGRMAGDFLRSPVRSDEEVLASVHFDGVEHVEAVEAMGKGIIAVTGHFGNFERFAHVVTASGRKITVVARDANQSGFQERIAKLRAASRVSVLSRGEAAQPVVQCLRRNELVGILPDQNSEESFIPFFGKPCGTVLGPAVLHRRTKAPILPAFCARVGVGQYRVMFFEPIDPECREKDLEVLMTKVNASLEKVIREYPEQWLWMHDRWKSARRRGLL